MTAPGLCCGRCTSCGAALPPETAAAALRSLGAGAGAVCRACTAAGRRLEVADREARLACERWRTTLDLVGPASQVPLRTLPSPQRRLTATRKCSASTICVVKKSITIMT